MRGRPAGCYPVDTIGVRFDSYFLRNMKFTMNANNCNYRIITGSREEALGRASKLAEEGKTSVALAVERGRGKFPETVLSVTSDGKVKKTPVWDALALNQSPSDEEPVEFESPTSPTDP